MQEDKVLRVKTPGPIKVLSAGALAGIVAALLMTLVLFRFYVVTKNIIDPQVNPELWRLEIGGIIERPRSYTFSELTSLPSVTQETTLMCINTPGTRLTWALWNYDWKPEQAGEYKLVVRATDGDGALQIKEERWTAPHGATGYHKVIARVVT